MKKNIFFNLLNNSSYKLDLKNQLLLEFFNNSLLWGGGGQAAICKNKVLVIAFEHT